MNKCIAVHPSDIAPALIALNAKIITTARTIDAESFWAFKVLSKTVLAPGEITTQIQIPAPPAGAKSAFIKSAIRKSPDFPIVNCAATDHGGAPRICLNAVAPKPYRATQAESAIAGKPINEANAAAAGAKLPSRGRPAAPGSQVQGADCQGHGETRPAGNRLKMRGHNACLGDTEPKKGGDDGNTSGQAW